MTPEELAVAWHDVEFGTFVADVPTFRQLASEFAGPVLDLGTGTGRVALEVARDGHRVTSVDHDPVFVHLLNHRGRGLPFDAVQHDATDLPKEWAERFGLILGASNFAQIIGPPPVREAMFASVAACLAPDGVLALALIEGDPPPDFVGWEEPELGQVGPVRLRSWTVAGVGGEGGRYDLWREREARFPDGRRTTERVLSYSVWHPSIAEIERELAACGLERLRSAEEIPAEFDETPSHLHCFHRV